MNASNMFIKGDPETLRVVIANESLGIEKSHQFRTHSFDFSWGYGGSGPAQLALAILLEFLEPEVAQQLYQDFKFEIISDQPQDKPLGISFEDVETFVKSKTDCESKLDSPWLPLSEDLPAHQILFRFNSNHEFMLWAADKEWDEVVKYASWGTYGKSGKDPLRWVFLKDCTNDHLEAILRTEPVGGFTTTVINLILKKRKIAENA